MKRINLKKGLVLMGLPIESQGLCEAVAKTCGIPIHFTDVGKTNANENSQIFINQYRPEWVLNLGVAGSRSIQGQLVECTSITQRSDLFPDFVQNVYKQSPITNLKHVMCGSEDFVDFKGPQLNCDIFDREAYTLAYVCDRRNIRYNSIKYINKVSGEDAVKEWCQNLEAASVALSDQLKLIMKNS